MNTYLTKEELFPQKPPNNVLNRIKDTIKYLEDNNLQGKIADCGENNPMKEAIENHFNIKIDSIEWNFNWFCHNVTEDYDVILCFEVLEHVMNPLLFLNQLRDLLNSNGVIYLSTPYQQPQILKAIHHYHEIPTDRLMWLFKSAKLTVKDSDRITIAGNWYNHILGIRPVLRYFQKTRIYKLVKSIN